MKDLEILGMLVACVSDLMVDGKGPVVLDLIAL